MSLCSHCVQGLANESSNHSYGSLGSSSDKESEVKTHAKRFCSEHDYDLFEDRTKDNIKYYIFITLKLG